METNGMPDYSRLGLTLDESAAFDQDVAHLLESAWDTSSLRQAVCMAFCRAALEHATSQRTLIGIGNNGTALALIRLHFETVVRAAWVLECAKDEWLEEFAKPVDPGDLSEPQMGPPIPSMLDAIGLKVPVMAQELQKLYATVKVMHSFVHGGAHLVVHALRGYPPDKMVDVLRNRNLLTLMLCNVLVVSSNKREFQGTVGRLSATHASCMPPLAIL
jgi:hypothetical protein